MFIGTLNLLLAGPTVAWEPCLQLVFEVEPSRGTKSFNLWDLMLTPVTWCQNRIELLDIQLV